MQTRRLSTFPFTVERSVGSDGWGLIALLVSGLLLGACSDDSGRPASMGTSAGATSGAAGTVSAGSGGGSNNNNTSGNGGASGGSTSGGGASGSGGAGGAMGAISDNPEFGFKVPCPPPAQALILDFSSAGGSPSADAGGVDAGAPAPVRDTTFGTFGVTLAGGTYSYPGDGAWPIGSDVSQGNWHLTGNVGTFSGFGLYIGGCNVLDASPYDGISFTVSGSVAMGNALTLNVATSANDISHVWFNTVAMPAPATPAGVNSGRCIPASNPYDGSCASRTSRCQ